MKGRKLMNLLRTIRRPLSLIVVVLSLATAAKGQTFTVIRSFDHEDNATGLNPLAPLVQAPDNTLYGVTSGGGTDDFGVVFRIQPDGTGFTVLRSFSGGSDGANPAAGLVLLGGTLYGTTENGGNSGNGTVFEINTDGSGFAVLKGFPATDPVTGANVGGANPYGALALSGSTLYGTTFGGGSWGWGGIFKLNTDGSGFTNVYSFTGGNDGGNPTASLTLSGNTLYGTTENGGNWDWGTVFEMNTDGSGFTNLYSFAFDDGAFPKAGLMLAGGTLYGTTENGGSAGWGTVFRVEADGTSFATIKNFTGGSDGANPYGGLVLAGTTLYGTTEQGGGVNPATAGNGVVFKINTDGSGFDVLNNFSEGNSGVSPYAGVILSGSTLYGTTFSGGNSDYGTVFKVNVDHTGFAVLESFSGGDGATDPVAGLTLSGSTLYGTTESGGSSGQGTVFKLNTDGSAFTVLKNFSGTNEWAAPMSGLLLSGSTIYGTTWDGGGSSGQGTVFKMNTDGSGFTNLHNFTASNGSLLYAGLVLSGSTLYGTAAYGGSSGNGTVFQIGTDGSGFAVIKSFSGGSDGALPFGGLVLSNSIIYGTTYNGGASGNGTVFKLNTDGSNFIVLRNLSGTDGINPYSGLVLSGGTLYGTTEGGGYSPGTVFKVNIDGNGFTVLKSFSGGSDGNHPYGALVLSGNTLYGTTQNGGNSSNGTVYKVNTDGSGFTVLNNFIGGGGGG